MTSVRFPLAKLLLGSVVFMSCTQAAWAWGWWYVASIATGAAVCVLTGGIGVPVVAGLVVGSAGTAAVGNSVYDDIKAAALSPVGGPLIFQRADPAPLVLIPIADPATPPDILADLNAARQSAADALRWARGIRESARRFFGAKLMGDAGAMTLQAGFVREFLAREEAASAQAVTRYRSYLAKLRLLLVPTDATRTTVAEYKAFRDDVAANGLPVCIRAEFNQLQLTPAELTRATNFIALRSDAEIDVYFANFPPSGVFMLDALDQAINQFEAAKFRTAIPPEIFGVCDVDRDGDIDVLDLNAMVASRNLPAPPGDPRDADGDGVITINDARLCSLHCTRPGCATR